MKKKYCDSFGIYLGRLQFVKNLEIPSTRIPKLDATVRMTKKINDNYYELLLLLFPCQKILRVKHIYLFTFSSIGNKSYDLTE